MSDRVTALGCVAAESAASRRRWRALALLIWCGAFLVVIGRFFGGHSRCVPFRVYSTAARHWMAHEPLYDTTSIDGFQYLPQAAMVFAPFVWLGSPLGDILWRAIGWGLLSLGILRLARRVEPERGGRCFAIATALSIAPSVGSLANGQANLMLAALTVCAASESIDEHWWRAAVALTIGFALKPLMVVMLLLAWALYRPLMWRIPVAVGLLLIVPWAARDHLYVITQYRDCLTKLRMSERPDRFFEDLRGLLRTLGWLMPHSIFLITRAVAALGTLALCVRVRTRDPDATLLFTGFAVAYLMLFNPRTQSNSYVIAAPIAALLAATSWVRQRKRLAVSLALVIVAWSGNSTHSKLTEHWLKPLACVAFWALLVLRLVERNATDRRWDSTTHP
jgi:hypothetical protein